MVEESSNVYVTKYTLWATNGKVAAAATLESGQCIQRVQQVTTTAAAIGYDVCICMCICVYIKSIGTFMVRSDVEQMRLDRHGDLPQSLSRGNPTRFSS